MFLILGLLLVAIHPSKNCYSFDNCNLQLHWQEILGDWLYLLFLLFPAVTFWITLSVPNSPCSVSTSSCTTSTPLSTNYFSCSIANWIFTILRLTTSSLSIPPRPLTPTHRPGLVAPPRIRFATGALTMSLSLLSVDSYSVSDSYSTLWLFCVSTLLLVAQSPSENVCPNLSL